MADWDAWIGRSQSRSDRIDSAAAGRWLATLDREAPLDGTVPQGFHWCLCLPDAPTGRLAPDGHPRRDDGPDSFLPPVPLPRRMWASSTVEFLTPLRIGEVVTRTSRILSVTEKSGGSGRLVFVDVAHDVDGERGIAVREVQSLVYREAAARDAPLSPPVTRGGSFEAGGWDAHRMVVPGEPLLFRFSALTFNSHRIHYDLAYARDEERYRALVVQGPLTASLLLDLARQVLGENQLVNFAFRGLSPAICGEALHLAMRGPAHEIELAAFAADGRQIMACKAQRTN
jgi:3-methylfumaryl-CoA hydratase